MKPHLNSLDLDFYLDLHQIAQTHEYQSPKNVTNQAAKIRPNVFKNLFLVWDFKWFYKVTETIQESEQER